GNDAINATDAAMVLSAAAAVGAGVDSGLTEEQMKAADVDGNGSFDASDASYILAYAAYTGAGGADSLDEFLESLVEPDVPCEPDVPTEPDVPCEPDNPIVAQLCYENKGGYIEITGCQTNDITELVIPAEIDGVPVKSIANKAFQQYTDLVSVSIADGVTSIGDFAFWNCSGLTSITLPDSIENIGEAAFSNSGSLESIHVSENNKFFKSVDGVLFSKDGTALLAFPWAKTCNSYIIPDGVTTVGDYAFFSCKNLNAVIIPTTVKSVEKRAFDWCVNLTAICYTGTEEEWKEIVIANEDEDEYPPAPVIQYNYVSKIS
ncbi:MAG: leucine-rich repeat protein, partial [Oscillospiraceae bacterium]|nr:leucine-rich repeat protein [Oscillospiraceae bacterium]